MTSIATTYLGLPLKSPLVMSSSPLCEDLDTIRRAEDAGAGAIVLHSLDVKEAERALMDAALARTEGNRTRAAALLGMSVSTLRCKLNRDGSDAD